MGAFAQSIYFTLFKLISTFHRVYVLNGIHRRCKEAMPINLNGTVDYEFIWVTY